MQRISTLRDSMFCDSPDGNVEYVKITMPSSGNALSGDGTMMRVNIEHIFVNLSTLPVELRNRIITALSR